MLQDLISLQQGPQHTLFCGGDSVPHGVSHGPELSLHVLDHLLPLTEGMLATLEQVKDDPHSSAVCFAGVACHVFLPSPGKQWCPRKTAVTSPPNLCRG